MERGKRMTNKNSSRSKKSGAQTKKKPAQSKNSNNNIKDIKNINNMRFNNNINNISYGGAAARGRVGDAERYRERTRAPQKFPNRREKYLTGRDLTTPLGKRRLDPLERQKRAEAHTKKYNQAAKELANIRVKPKVKKIAKQKLSASAVCFLFVFAVILAGLIHTNVLLHEKDAGIINLKGDVSYETKQEAILSKELEAREDLNKIIEYAVNELGMVKEEVLQKNYLASVPENKAVVMAEKNDPVIDLITELPGMLAAFLSGRR